MQASCFNFEECWWPWIVQMHRVAYVFHVDRWRCMPSERHHRFASSCTSWRARHTCSVSSLPWRHFVKHLLHVVLAAFRAAWSCLPRRAATIFGWPHIQRRGDQFFCPTHHAPTALCWWWRDQFFLFYFYRKIIGKKQST